MKSHISPIDATSTEHDKKESMPPVLDTPVTTTAKDTSVESSEENIRALLEKNIKWSQVIYHQNRKIQRRLTWMTIGSYIRLFVILIPLIVGIFFVSDFISQNGDLLNGAFQNWRTYFEILRSNQ